MNNWLQSRLRDPYVKVARAQGFRSRAAFKLRQIDEKNNLLRKGMRVIDLGACPGSWSQYAVSRVGASGCVMAVDVISLLPINGVYFVRGDCASPQARENVLAALAGRKADVIMSDMAARFSGNMTVDMARAVELAYISLDFARECLAAGGSLLTKLFQGEGFNDCLVRLGEDFSKLRVIKPLASRARSREVYALATGFTL